MTDLVTSMGARAVLRFIRLVYLRRGSLVGRSSCNNVDPSPRNESTIDRLPPPSLRVRSPSRSTQEEMDGRQCSSRNELESTCGRRLTRAAAVIRFLTPPMPQHVPISSPFQVCFSVGARVGRGGAIYQNVSPLVSANGRRPTPISRTTLAAGREGGSVFQN